MTNKLENVKAAKRHFKGTKWTTFGDGKLTPHHIHHNVCADRAVEALTIYQAILEKRVLLVPVEADRSMKNAGYDAWEERITQGRITHGMSVVYLAMTQAVDQDELLKEILG